jgi:NADH-quinone oxidoreductase subunit E
MVTQTMESNRLSKSESKQNSDQLPFDVMDKVIKKHQGKPGELLSTLEEMQHVHPNKYLPASTLAYVSKSLGVPLSQVYSVATFYSYFNLKPQGEHCIMICRGTACHTKGSKVILDTLKDYFKLKEDPAEEGEKIFLTTDDRKFTIRTIACFGQCALAPVLEIDGVIYSNMTTEKVKKALEEIK